MKKKQIPRIPRAWYSEDRSGLLDPDKVTPQERRDRPLDLLHEEYARRTQQGPVVAKLQAATDAALGRRKGK